jgi:hypothetical protein
MGELVSSLLSKLICSNVLGILHHLSSLLVWQVSILLLVRESADHLVLLNDLFELFSINALSLVITEYHCLSHLLVLGIGLLLEEFLDTIAIDMELLLITEFALSQVFIS